MCRWNPKWSHCRVPWGGIEGRQSHSGNCTVITLQCVTAAGEQTVWNCQVPKFVTEWVGICIMLSFVLFFLNVMINKMYFSVKDTLQVSLQSCLVVYLQSYLGCGAEQVKTEALLGSTCKQQQKKGFHQRADQKPCTQTLPEFVPTLKVSFWPDVSLLFPLRTKESWHCLFFLPKYNLRTPQFQWTNFDWCMDLGIQRTASLSVVMCSEREIGGWIAFFCSLSLLFSLPNIAIQAKMSLLVDSIIA